VDRDAYAPARKNADGRLFAARMASNVEGVYGDTKLMQAVISRELDRRVLARGVRSFAVHPGRPCARALRRTRRHVLTLLRYRVGGWVKDGAGDGRACEGLMATAPQASRTRRLGVGTGAGCRPRLCSRAPSSRATRYRAASRRCTRRSIASSTARGDCAPPPRRLNAPAEHVCALLREAGRLTDSARPWSLQLPRQHGGGGAAAGGSGQRDCRVALGKLTAAGGAPVRRRVLATDLGCPWCASIRRAECKIASPSRHKAVCMLSFHFDPAQHDQTHAKLCGLLKNCGA